MLAAVPIFANDRLPSGCHGCISSQGVSPTTCKVKVRFDHRESVIYVSYNLIQCFFPRVAGEVRCCESMDH